MLSTFQGNGQSYRRLTCIADRWYVQRLPVSETGPQLFGQRCQLRPERKSVHIGTRPCVCALDSLSRQGTPPGARSTFAGDSEAWRQRLALARHAEGVAGWAKAVWNRHFSQVLSNPMAYGLGG